MDTNNDNQNFSFLFKNSGYIIYITFLIGLLLNLFLFITYLKLGQWFLGIWAVFSIIIIPKAVLAIILVVGYKDAINLNMPIIFNQIFPNTMQKYGNDLFSYNRSKVLAKHTLLLIISFIPLIIYIINSP